MELFTKVFMVTKVSFSVVSLLNGSMKILVGYGIFNRFIFEDLGSAFYCKTSISQRTNIY